MQDDYRLAGIGGREHYVTGKFDALGAWVRRLGTDRVITDPGALGAYSMNVTEYAPRRVPALLLARTREEVESVVAIANVYLAALCPFSMGRN